MNKPKLYLCLGLGLMALVFLLLSPARTVVTNQATLNLVVAPKNAQVYIDGSKTSRKGGTIQLSPGTHQVSVRSDGFVPKQLSVTVKGRSSTTQYVNLAPATTNAYNYYARDQAAELHAESVEGHNITSGSAQLAQEYPILSRLPVYGDGYNIDLGASMKHPDQPGYIALYVSCARTTDYCQAAVQKWLQSQGFNPADYEIDYLNTNNS